MRFIRGALFLPLWAFAACGHSQSAADTDRFTSHFGAAFNAETSKADVTLRIQQSARLLIELDFNAPQDKYELINADGETKRDGKRLIWQVPPRGGTLTLRVEIDSRRGKAYDAKHEADWVIVRLDDLFPGARARILKRATGTSTLKLTGPTAWGFDTRYGKVTAEAVALPDEDRSFVRPTGWLCAGKIGTRREFISGRAVAVTAPRDIGMQRLETLAFLNWTLPVLTETFPDLSPSLLIVGAPPTMWRGGLSAPGSLYVNADRALISENGTSTLLHELIHMAGMHSAQKGADWIVEGVAEYYSLQILLRSGGITSERFEIAMADQVDWAAKDNGRLAHPSSGANTAYAVTVLHALDGELQARGASLDELVQRLRADGEISNEAIAEHAQALLGKPSRVLTQALDRASEK